MAFGLIIIGDEILSGKRTDKHFAGVREILAARGLDLAWVTYLGDDRERLTQTFTRTFAGEDVVFSCGGIGATPDDHTRQAAARALHLPLEPHPEALHLITQEIQRREQTVTPGHLRMGEFPLGADIIPNPVNRVPGFAIRQHWFVPGFPEMAWPMFEWVLDTHYAHLFHAHPTAERVMIVRGLAEAVLTPLMEQVQRGAPGVKVFSLPRLNPQRYEIELGVKGPPGLIEAAFATLRQGTADMGGEIEAIQ
jgi:molybdopterin-biosynthesis enzyme MoeA-like protein